MTLYTLRLLIEMHECVPGVRFDRYRDLGVAPLARGWASQVVVPQQLIVRVGCDVVYMVTGSNCLQKFAQIVSPNSAAAPVLLDPSSAHSVPALPARDLNSITAISLAAASWHRPPRHTGHRRVLPVAFIGYWAFGQGVSDNVLVALERPPWLVAAANMMVVIHVLGSYQGSSRGAPPPGGSIYLRRAHLFVAVTFPFFGDLLSFFGGFGFTPTSFFLPASCGSRSRSLGGCIVVGVLLMLVSTIGGLRSIIQDASTFKFYS
ncbi:hypothetical protein QYE76_000083 [Lolium multiflorum]|uniref:Amino acid transporter transmembrane domain-containing protein n=1 Tax=Lolium multiflorum TaxID=4521 RepID=A0AAD8PHV0_LOLMU|nr:hypothetical protein QYE76_000083 [Lolium multiflorum]